MRQRPLPFWVNCIDQTIGDRRNVWLPSDLDALIGLAAKRPDGDYTRHADLPNEEKARALVDRSNAIIHTIYLPVNHPVRGEEYEGLPRQRDIELVTNYQWLQYRHMSSEKLGLPWQGQVCQVGAFWAWISIRN